MGQIVALKYPLIAASYTVHLSRHLHQQALDPVSLRWG
jgi:hypothetical protein